jgi:uncharacterized protein YlxW (UPF0749 family)
MKNIIISIFIILFIVLLLNTIIVKSKCIRVIEGMEGDDTDLSIKERFNKLQERVKNLQSQIESAERSNQENADQIVKIKKSNK